MVAGNPDKIAFIIEKVSDWSSCGCTNGIMQLYINGIQYPEELRTTAIDGEIYNILGSTSPLVNMPQNKMLFDLPLQKFLEAMCTITFEKGDYRYAVPLQELEDAGYYLFMVCSESKSRFVIAQHKKSDNFKYKNEIIADNREILTIKEKLIDFKENYLR